MDFIDVFVFPVAATGEFPVAALRDVVDVQSAFVEVTLTADTHDVPAGVVRILYRRRLGIVDVTPVARRHLQLTARPRRWAA